MKEKLLSRGLFREQVFKRDNNKCVFCSMPAVDAHHILERKLWPDGGYYLSNGASVCEEHHLACERTIISVEDVRKACEITKFTLPPHLYDETYDKWGNIVLPNGLRLKGELFFDDSVQKVLEEGNALSLFTDYVKYPRTHHVPWSQSIPEDDRVIQTLDNFIGKRVIVTEKLDGENTSMYTDHIHARSINSGSHPSRSWVKQLWNRISADIPKGWRICGENLYAEHSVPYTDLPSYFMGFSIWTDKNICLSWYETLEYFSLLDIVPVPVLYDGTYDEKIIRSLYDDSKWECMEGYVIRVSDAFTYSDFKFKVAKFVRDKHVQTVKHWMHGQPVKKNGLKNEQIF
jgi:hypothetical protein